MKLISGFILFLGFMALLGFLIERLDESKSSSWPTASGKVIAIKDRHFALPIISSIVPIATPYAKYSYSVDGLKYVGEKTSGPSITWIRHATFKSADGAIPDVDEIIRRLKRSGRFANYSAAVAGANDLFENMHNKPIKIRYDEDHPEISFPDPDVLQGGRSLWWTSIFLICLGGLGMAILFYHSYMSTPVEDPALSLEAALRAQRQRR